MSRLSSILWSSLTVRELLILSDELNCRLSFEVILFETQLI